MATENALQTITREAGSDLSERQYRFMTINATGQLAVPSAGGAADGILQNDPNAQGRAGSLAISGQSKLEMGVACTAGDLLTPGANGLGAIAGTGDVVAAKALEDASGNGSKISVLLKLQAEPLA